MLSERRYSPTCWSDDETKALLEFLLLHRRSDKWPSTKDKVFRNGPAEFVELRGKGRVRRSGNELHVHVHNTLANKIERTQPSYPRQTSYPDKHLHVHTNTRHRDAQVSGLGQWVFMASQLSQVP